jgi:hypothetical protein
MKPMKGRPSTEPGGAKSESRSARNQRVAPTVTTLAPETWPKPKSGSRLRGIFDMLVQNTGQEVAMIDLSSYSGSLTVHSQISELRENYQLAIENRCVREHDGIQINCHSFYRLLGRILPQTPEA